MLQVNCSTENHKYCSEPSDSSLFVFRYTIFFTTLNCKNWLHIILTLQSTAKHVWSGICTLQCQNDLWLVFHISEDDSEIQNCIVSLLLHYTTAGPRRFFFSFSQLYIISECKCIYNFLNKTKLNKTAKFNLIDF